MEYLASPKDIYMIEYIYKISTKYGELLRKFYRLQGREGMMPSKGAILKPT